MAVYQISRIQVRRGRKGSETGIPRLASGEMAWAVDSRELYIGNGSAAEGSPAPAENTKIITQHDNIFDLFAYIYKQNERDVLGNSIIQTGETQDAPVSQSVSAILDRTVWAESFGIFPDHETGTSNEAIEIRSRAFQRALNELYIRDAHTHSQNMTLEHEYKVALRFTPGEYTFDRTFYIPSYAIILGSGKDRTIFVNNNDGAPQFKFIANTFSSFEINAITGQFDQTPADTTLTSEKVVIAGLTVKSDKAFDMKEVRDSVFANISATPSHGVNAVFATAEASHGNQFTMITVDGFTTVINATGSNLNRFDKFTLGTADLPIGECGFTFNDSNDNVISNSRFDVVTSEGIVVISGARNKSENNVFVNVNGVNAPIKFVTPGNYSIGDVFSRYSDQQNHVTQYQGNIYHQNLTTRKVQILADTATTLLSLLIPAEQTCGYRIEYVYEGATVQSVMRKGVLNVAITKLTASNRVQLTDEYETIGDVSLENENIPSQAAHPVESLEFLEQESNGNVVISLKNHSTIGGTITLTYSLLMQ